MTSHLPHHRLLSSQNCSALTLQLTAESRLLLSSCRYQASWKQLEPCTHHLYGLELMEQERKYPFSVISADQLGNQALQGLVWVEKKRGTLGKAWGAGDGTVGSRARAGMRNAFCIAWSITACVRSTAQMPSDRAGHELLCCFEKAVVSAGSGVFQQHQVCRHLLSQQPTLQR